MTDMSALHRRSLHVRRMRADRLARIETLEDAALWIGEEDVADWAVTLPVFRIIDRAAHTTKAGSFVMMRRAGLLGNEQLGELTVEQRGQLVVELLR